MMLEVVPGDPIEAACGFLQDGPSLTDALEAARVKAQFLLSYADAFAVSTALRSQAIVITGDPEFHTVEHLVEIAWL
jgi:hypothetical protein